MKKHVLTLAAASVLAANAAVADVTVYGKANVSLQTVDVEFEGDTTQDNWKLNSNASRIGVKGSKELSEGLKAVYKFEYETYLDDGEKGKGDTFKQRNIYVGVKGDFGTIMTGMHDSPLKMAGKKIDVFSDLEAADIKYSMVGENRQKNMIMYKSNDLNGFKINAMVAPGEESGTDSDDKDGPADHKSVSVTYAQDGLTVAVAMDMDMTSKILNGDDDLITDDKVLFDTTRLVVAYDAKGFGVAGMYQVGEVAEDGVDDVEETAIALTGYYKTGNWKLKALMVDSEFEEGSDSVETSQLVLGADYKLSKKTKAYVYRAALETEYESETIKETTTFGVGLEHKF